MFENDHSRTAVTSCANMTRFRQSLRTELVSTISVGLPIYRSVYGRSLRQGTMLIGYMRVSTEDQNLDLQRDALERAACEKIFEDKASGAKDGRPGLEQALSHLREGDCLVVWKLDRLDRRASALIRFVEELQQRGIGFRVLDGGQPIDTTTSQGKFFFTIMAAMAEMERGLIRERTHAGLAAARARGRKGGRKPELNAKQICQARKLLNDPDTTIKDVAETFGVSRATIYRSLGLGSYAKTTTSAAA
jgi:DNA invertase Pin-like site-specific DNA recombinase